MDLGVLPDDGAATREALAVAALQCNAVITTGGVSMGRHDHVKPSLEQLPGGRVLFGRLRMKPGKPTTVAVVENSAISGASDCGAVPRQCMFFGLPGNPASALATFHLLVAPALRRMMGATPGQAKGHVFRARLGLPVRRDTLRTDFQRGIANLPDSQSSSFAQPAGGAGPRSGSFCPLVTPTGGQASSRPASFRGANALIRVPSLGEQGPPGSGIAADRPRVLPAGTMLECVLIGNMGVSGMNGMSGGGIGGGVEYGAESPASPLNKQQSGRGESGLATNVKGGSWSSSSGCSGLCGRDLDL